MSTNIVHFKTLEARWSVISVLTDIGDFFVVKYLQPIGNHMLFPLLVRSEG